MCLLYLSEFITWKEQYENESCSSYVKATGNKGEQKNMTYFHCNRSGKMMLLVNEEQSCKGHANWIHTAQPLW